MQLNGAEIVIECLKEQGVDTVFGYPGGAILNVYDELYKHRDEIRHILTSHEQGASHAADGYARATGKVGVCLATSGPGATNLVTGIATAYMDSIPIVAITCNVGVSLLGKDSFQEIDITGITMPITKYSFIVKDVTKLADTIRKAFRIAKTGRPGPVLVDIPKNVQIEEVEFENRPAVEKTEEPEPSMELLSKAVELINKSERPLIFCGGGVINGNCSEFIEPIAEKADAFVSFSMMGLSAMDCDSPRHLGMNGMHGRYAATKVFTRADVVIAAGVRFSERATGNKMKFAPGAKIIHLDIDPAEQGKNIDAFLQIAGNLKSSLKYILDNIDEKKHEAWSDEVNKFKTEEAAGAKKSECMMPWDVIRTVNKKAGPDTNIATDVGQHQMWVAQYYPFKDHGQIVTSGGLGTMGFGIPAAIGAKLAAPDKTVVAFVGDGGFQMTNQEMAILEEYNLDIKIVIINNGTLGMVKQWQDKFFNKRFSHSVFNGQPDFLKLAEAYNVKGYLVENPSQLEQQLDAAFQHEGPALIDVHISPIEPVSPMVPSGKANHEMEGLL